MSLQLAAEEKIPQVRSLIDPESCGAVYPLSVVQGKQTGIILTENDTRTVLVLHNCGFAYLYGNITESVLSETAAMMQNPKPYSRMILMTQDSAVKEYFSMREHFVQEERLFYRYNAEVSEYENSEATEISMDTLTKIKGRITPAFSWTDNEQFLHNGKGFFVQQDGEPAAWAFSAAVSDTEIDIGIETNEAFRRRGLASKAARAMIAYVISQGKRPVWACHEMNTASRRIAESLGFTQYDTCKTVRFERS